MKQTFFLHIPKNSGSTLNQVLARNFRKTYAVSWDSAKDNHHQKLISNGKTDFNDAELISGHFPYGLHSLCRDPSEVRYLTMLRHPIGRSISAYNYLLNDSPYVNRTPSLKAYLSALGGIESFYDNYHSEIPNHIYSDNGQVRYISGIGDSKPYGGLDESDLELAKDNLIKMIFGITEEFDRSMLYFEHEILSHSAVYKIKRKGSRKQNSFTPSTFDILKRRNSLDIELYEFATQVFKERTKKISNYQLFMYKVRLYLFRLISLPKSIYHRHIK